MALGPFARVIAQAAIVAGSALGKAVLEAYREAAAGRGSGAAANAAKKFARKKMSLDEARNILTVEASTEVEKVEERCAQLCELNADSPYLQERIKVAQKIILAARTE
uniref:Mitochondrial import inner membrane translocase subunit TIM16 n=1 Tax=Alexandrium andersonii TaxID=327968 RepID=A0A7S2MUY0_9DINO|mmetsp:Transcript_76374/g.170870  ORF Transcript_76374/g.170870 Transcript_76374/m.170870 type:complete len:108 (+) Transcript_76374:3-326(+)